MMIGVDDRSVRIEGSDGDGQVMMVKTVKGQK